MQAAYASSKKIYKSTSFSSSQEICSCFPFYSFSLFLSVEVCSIYFLIASTPNIPEVLLPLTEGVPRSLPYPDDSSVQPSKKRWRTFIDCGDDMHQLDDMLKS